MIGFELVLHELCFVSVAPALQLLYWYLSSNRIGSCGGVAIFHEQKFRGGREATSWT